MKHCLLIISLLITSVLRAGDEDSLPPHELAIVSIVEKLVLRTNTYGFVSHSLDSLQVARYFSADIGRLFDQLGLVNVTTYGAPGGAVLARSNGLAPDHTGLFWRGMPLNSPTLGMADMSLIPAFFFPRTRYNLGVSASTNTRSGLAANIALDSDNVLTDVKQAEFYQDYSSLNNFFTGASAGAKVGKWFSSVKVFYNDLKNHYEYTDLYNFKPVTLVQRSHQGQSYGAFTSWKKEGAHSWDLVAWNVDRKMQLPYQKGIHTTNEQYQNDNQIRLFAEHSTSHVYNNFDENGYTKSKILTARWVQNLSYLRDQQSFFTKGTNSIHSSLVVNQFQGGGTVYLKRIANPLNSSFSVTGNATQALYDDTRKVNMNSVLANSGAHYQGENFIWTGSLAGEYREKWGLAHAASTSLNYSYNNERKQYLVVGLSLSQKMRLPDMNELYWVPGGNPNLKPELSNTAQISLSSDGLLQRYGIWLYDWKSSFSVSEVHDWIQWIPQGAVWTPVNYKEVHVKTGEMEVKVTRKKSRSITSFYGKYQVTEAKGSNLEWNKDNAFNMVYTPRHRFYTEVNQTLRFINWSAGARYVGARFTDESNTETFSLDPYVVYDASVAWIKQWSKAQSTIRLKVDNLLDVEYESVRGFAQPARVISLQLNVRFTREKVKEKTVITLDNE